jgi:septal ring factor EnvC (AmiA/AmiB activator)
MIMEYLILTRLDKISRQLRNLNRKVHAMSETLDQLATRVAAIEDAGDSIIAILAGVKTQLDAALANNDMSAVQALSDRLDVQTQELLAASALENTPADPEPV